VLAAITIIILAAIYFVLPQGRKPDPTISLKPKAVLKNFYGVIRQPQFLIYTLAGGFATSAPFAYIAGSAHVFINLHHVSEEEYGWIFAIVAAVIIASTQMNHLLLKKFSSQGIIKVTLLCQTLIGIFLLTGTINGWFDKVSLIVFISLFLAGHGLTNPNATALSLAPFVKHTGSAASLLGSFRMMMGGIVSALVSAFNPTNAVPMISVMVGCVACGLIILFTGKTTVRYKARKRDVENEPSVLM
jgi:MFS transporter, DHA1 family, multidrug resistance protein